MMVDTKELRDRFAYEPCRDTINSLADELDAVRAVHEWKPIESFPTDDASFVYRGRNRKRFLFFCRTHGLVVGVFSFDDQTFHEHISWTELRPMDWMELPEHPERQE